MTNWLKTLWQKEAVVITAIGGLVTGTAFWFALFPLLAAFGHPLTTPQQQSILGLVGVISTIVARGQVYSQATHDATITQTVKDVNDAQALTGSSTPRGPVGSGV